MIEKKYFEVTLDFKGKPFLFDESSLTELKQSYLGLGRGTIGLYFGEDSTLGDTRTGSKVNCSAGELWDLLMKAEFKLKELRQEFHNEQLRELAEQGKKAKELKRKEKHRQEVERVAREQLFDAGFRRVKVLYHDETYIQLSGEKRHWFSKRSYVKTFKIEKKNADRGTWFLLPVSEGVL
ncbi:hypothetical protein 010DV004_126 [Bacillus phage 010DV004]|nr:hypothetical protein 010DV004_126 [Bacillus phage 010DV004]QZA69343.1 hypothetical protein 010DV005_126 [Bacillus phage 010DV005]